MDEKKTPDPWAIPETDEKKSEAGGDAFDATQWHEVQKGEWASFLADDSLVNTYLGGG